MFSYIEEKKRGGKMKVASIRKEIEELYCKN